MANSDSSITALKKYIESEQLSLPVFDAVSLRIQLELVKKDPDFRIVEKFIVADQALSSNLLKIANSARFGGFVDITTVKSAIMRVGMTEISRMITMDINQKMFSCRDRQVNLIMKKLWQHSMGCAFTAGLLSKRLDFGVMQNEAFFAGLFHDIGKLLILKVIAEKKKKDTALVVSDEMLYDALDLLHAEQGYLLMQQINMPEVYAVIARDHHMQAIDRENYLLILVRMANLVCHHLAIGLIVYDAATPILETEEALLLELAAADLEALQVFLASTPSLTQ